MGESECRGSNYVLADDDEVIWYYGGWAAEILRLSSDSDNFLATVVFTLRVVTFTGNDWVRVENATVLAGSHIYTTDVNGQVANISLPPGGYDIYAQKDTFETYIRSNSISVVVYVPLDLKAGWNFISVPKRLADNNSTAGTLFGSTDTGGHSIFAYDPPEGWVTLGQDDVIMPLAGIWIYSVEEVEIHPVFDTNPRQVPPTKELAAGWNAVGYSDFESASANSTLTSVENLWA